MEVVVLNLGRELARLGIDTRVVGAAEIARQAVDQGCAFRGLPTITVSNWIRFPTPGSLRTLRAEVRGADVVHVHNPPELFNLASIVLALIQGRPLCLSVFSPDTLRRHPRALYRTLGIFTDLMMRALMRRASFVHVKNRLDYQVAVQYNRHVLMIPDGLPEYLFTTPRGGRDFKSEFHLSDSSPILLYLGRLHPMKGPDQIIRALPELAEQFPRAAAVISGPDPDKMTPELERLAHHLGVDGRVRFTGPLTESGKIEAIDGSDLLVVPSIADFVEAFSIVASEAWARSKPVVAYPVGALAVRVDSGKNGVLSRSVTPRGLAEAIASAVLMGPVMQPADVVPWNVVAQRFATAYRELKEGGAVSEPAENLPTQGASAT